MQTRTKPQQTSRIGRRPAPAPQGRFKRHAAPKPSTSDKAMSALSGMMGGHSTAKKKGRGGSNAKGGRAGKMALLAGGVGLAMKNRGKLMDMLNKRSANRSAEAAAQPSPPPPPPGA
jgi:hypothetical protein